MPYAGYKNVVKLRRKWNKHETLNHSPTFLKTQVHGIYIYFSYGNCFCLVSILFYHFGFN